MPNEADTCRLYVVPKLQAAGWDAAPHRMTEQYVFTDGRIIVSGEKCRRRKGKRADYLLRYRSDVTVAVVEAKPTYETPSAGLGQAKDYAQVLGLKFAYASNGTGIVEFDFFTGMEREIDTFPSPDELWARYLAGSGIPSATVGHLLNPPGQLQGIKPRYYQEIAVTRAIEAILRGQRRVLLTMATGTGKTIVAFQICWKLWESLWNRTGEHRRPRMLYLADRNILIDDPKDKRFIPFADARHKIENGVANKSREMYFAIYQAIARDEMRPGLYREYPPDFFDLIIVDECHRGSARDESSWREILEYFAPAFQIGMTATPKRDENIDTYRYFGEAIYTYSLRDGIDDGFLAPYRLHRIVTTWDAAGWRPSVGDIDRYGHEIPDREYHTPDFERYIALRARTEAVAKNLTEFLRHTDRADKTIVFCVDQDHADEMRRALNNANADMVRANPNYVCRITSDEGEIGRGHLSNFQDVESRDYAPVIVTTSQMLSTGVDIPTCKNVVLVRDVGSITEFKQIIGRGTRVRDDYGKYFFSILDYTGTANRHFADPDFDGDPVRETETEIDDEGEQVGGEEVLVDDEVKGDGDDQGEEIDGPGPGPDDDEEGPRKYFFDGGAVEIAAHLVYELDADGKQLRPVKLTDYAGEKVRTLYPDVTELRRDWVDPQNRDKVKETLAERGIDTDELAKMTNRPDADPFDLLCHLAYNAPLHTRRDRAGKLKAEQRHFFEQYAPEARTILEEILDKYADHGIEQIKMPDVLRVPPIDAHGNVTEIIGMFGGVGPLRDAVNELQTLLYAA